MYQGPEGLVEAGGHINGHLVNRAQLDGPRVHLGPVVGQFQHLIVANLIQFAGLRNDLGVGGVDPVHIGVDLAPVGLQSRRQGHCRGVGAAPSQRRDVFVFGYPLESGHHYDPALVQLFLHPGRVHPVDPGPPVAGVGVDPCLGTREADRLLAQVPQGHGQ